MAFIGLSYSYEQYYQAVRRCWRFGQTSEVHAHVVMAESEAAILKTNERKQKQHSEMQAAMRLAINRTHELSTGKDQSLNQFNSTKKMELPSWLFKTK
jgi:SNF2 family DNA or RNA helicase